MISSVIIGCALAGAVLGLTLLAVECSALQRIAADAVAGAGTGFVILPADPRVHPPSPRLPTSAPG